MGYHHGTLREAILSAAASSIEREGPSALSMRALARDVGVTHTAPRHHFGGKRGVITALAAQGYRQLARDVRRANKAGDFVESGVAYTEFSRTHPGHFSVMFHPDLVDEEDHELRNAQDDLAAALTEGVAAYLNDSHSGAASGSGPASGDAASLARAAWAIAHGFATLARSGNLPAPTDQSEADLARQTLRHLAP
jgi:AcrR family transcriptional regulator